jgi:hypothetical protein
VVERVARAFAAERAADKRPRPRLLLAGGRARSLLAALSARLLGGDEGAVSGVAIEDNLVLRGVALRAHSEVGDPAESR